MSRVYLECSESMTENCLLSCAWVWKPGAPERYRARRSDAPPAGLANFHIPPSVPPSSSLNDRRTSAKRTSGRCSGGGVERSRLYRGPYTGVEVRKASCGPNAIRSDGQSTRSSVQPPGGTMNPITLTVSSRSSSLRIVTDHPCHDQVQVSATTPCLSASIP